eukprot:1830764-Prymnesium_polylepis.1
MARTGAGAHDTPKAHPNGTPPQTGGSLVSTSLARAQADAHDIERQLYAHSRLQPPAECQGALLHSTRERLVPYPGLRA